MGAEDFLRPGKVVGVVLHERGSARKALGHDLHDADEGGGLPVAFSTKAVARGHEALGSDSGELVEAVEVLEVVGEGSVASLFKECAHTKFDPGGDAEGVWAVVGFSDGVGGAVFVDEGVGFGIGELVDAGGEVADAVGVDAVA